MRSTARNLVWTAALCCAPLIASSCTPEELAPSPRQTAEGFVAAWTASEAATMASLLTPGTAEAWTEERLRRLLDRTMDDGDIDSIAVDLTGPVPTPEAPADETALAVVAYSVTYSSSAARADVVLEGEIPLNYSPEAGWGVSWSMALMWPGIDRVRGFEVESRWPRRAPILDRRGRVLARGSDADRSYPFGSVGGSTIGHLEPVEAREAEALRHAEGDLVGASGLEAAYEERLSGSPSTRLLAVDRRGREVEVLGRREGSRGRPVRAALDIEVQGAAASAFGSTVGGAVVLSPRTGEVLAVVSSGEIDPNNYVGIPDINPFNRALSGTYPPGSSLKVMTASAALDSGKFRPSSRLTGPAEYKGVRNFESGEFGSLDFATALKFSVNTAFAQIAEKVGGRSLTRYAEDFGFNSEPLMPLSAATSSFPRPQDLSDLMWGSIGQAQVLATPLQMASIAATVANGGVRIEPRSSLADPKERARVISARYAETLTDMMVGVVEGGTGVAARVSGLRVAGKTGTAEVDVDGKRMNHAWFICFAPADDPKVAIAVVSELGGIGGQVAAPLARAVLTRVLPLVR